MKNEQQSPYAVQYNMLWEMRQKTSMWVAKTVHVSVPRDESSVCQAIGLLQRASRMTLDKSELAQQSEQICCIFEDV